MRKITLMLFAFFALAFSWQGMAQTQVGTGTGNTTYLPIYSCYGYTYSQQVYYASEINTSGDITSVSFYLDPNTSTTDFSSSTDWTIYLGHSSRTEFASTTDWEDVTNLTQVFSGIVTFPAEDNWFTITLDTAFTYNGTDNLVLAIDENQSGYNCSMAWQKTDSAVNRGIVYRSDSTNPDPSTPPTASSVYTYYSNIIFGGISQACPDPSTLTVSNVTSSAADLAWTAGGSETEWNIEIVDITAGGSATGTATYTSVGNPYNLTGLTPANTYAYYVQANCGGDLSAWVGPVSFTTSCVPYTAPYSQNFDGESTPNINTCWTGVISGSTSTYADIVSSTTQSVSASNSVRFYNSSDVTGDYFLISPNFTDLDNTKRIRFSVYQNQGTTDEDDILEVGTMSDPADPGSYTTFQNIPYGDRAEDAWVDLTINFDTYTGSDSYIVIKMNFGGTYNYYYFDNFYYEEIPSCLEPSALTASNFTTAGADLGWTAGASETAWNVEVVEAGTTPTGTATATGVSNPYTESGLNPATVYEFYVQADCGGDTSPWVGPFEFSTLCNPVTTFPWTEDFESITTPALPVCWNYSDNNADSDFFKTWTGYGVGDSNAAGLYTDYNAGNNDDYLILPQFTLTGNERLKFSVRARSSTEPNDYRVVLSTTGNAPTDFTQELLALTTVSSTTHTEIDAINLSAYTGDVYIAIHVPSGGLDGWYIYFDDFIVEPLPSCVEPSALDVPSLTYTSADLTWTAGGTETLWNIEVVDITAGGSVTGTPTVTGVTAIPYTVTGLTADNDYEFYVQADCGSGTSTWVGPFAFYTGYCSSVPTSNDASGITNVQVGSTDFAGTDVTYLDFTGSPVDLAQNVTANLQITFATGYDYDTNVWIDFNDNLIFEASEQVFDGVSTITNPTTLDASFPVAVDAPLGTHRMRIGTADSGQATPDPCYGGAYGVTVDLDVNIIEAPSCLPPSGLNVSNLTSTSGDLGWTENGTATAWNVQVVNITLGGVFNPASTGNAGVGNPFTFPAFSANTEYEFYVQADCGGSTSDWVGPFSFSTPCDVIATFPYEDGFENSGEMSDCWSQEYVSATADWTYVAANGNTTVAPRTGSYMAMFNSPNYNGDATKLIMPAFDLTGLADPGIRFYYTQVDWGGDQDELRIYYKTSAAGVWTLLAEYTASTPAWSEVILQLPNASSEYYIAFEGTSGWGYGVTVDDVTIDEYPILGVDTPVLSGFRYYPNPVNGSLSLRAQNTIDAVSVYNMLGQEVINMTPNAMSKDIDMSALNSGNYFVRVSINGAVENFKIIKQ